MEYTKAEEYEIFRNNASREEVKLYHRTQLSQQDFLKLFNTLYNLNLLEMQKDIIKQNIDLVEKLMNHYEAHGKDIPDSVMQSMDKLMRKTPKGLY